MVLMPAIGLEPITITLEELYATIAPHGHIAVSGFDPPSSRL